MAHRTSRTDQQLSRGTPHAKRVRLPKALAQVHWHAAGIDVGATQHYVAVPEDCDAEPVRCFEAFTADLHRLADWLTICGIETVVMESTGVYWIPLFELLEQRGFEVLLVDARYVKYVPGRKTDVLDCQWLQQLHTFSLLRGAFRPKDQVCVLRSYPRQRAMLVRCAAQHIQHMQKALTQMNLKLQHVVKDITGKTGMAIMQAILAGQRDPQQLATHRDHRCKHDEVTIAKALVGHYREEHLFELRQAVELFDVYQAKIADCDTRIETYLNTFEDRSGGQAIGTHKRRQQRGRHAPAFDLRGQLYRISGVDLTRIDGVDAQTGAKVISEIGVDMTAWPTVKHFCSWLGLCPGSKVTGGKQLSSRSKRSANRAAAALRLAAQSLSNSSSAMGAFYRRLKARLGAPKAITATAHKLARTIYAMLTEGREYVDLGQDIYEQQYRQRVLKNLQRRARDLGYTLIKHEGAPSAEPVSVT